MALIDTGFNFQHEDIQSRVWVNAGEIPGNGVDDDGNGRGLRCLKRSKRAVSHLFSPHVA